MENEEGSFYFLEKQARQENIVYFGIQEKKISYLDFANIRGEFIKKYFNFNIERRDIQEIKRIGKKEKGLDQLLLLLLIWD